MSTPTSEEAPKSKKPSNSAFKQQRLKAWQPILTAGTVLPMFFGVGIAFIPIGIGLLISSNMVQEYVYDYTNCVDVIDNVTKCSDSISKFGKPYCVCNITFQLTEAFKGDVYMYYGLSNFYQNHRRYVKSRDDTQLSGKLDPNAKLGDCDPYAFIEVNGIRQAIAPCGAIANSLFNDSMLLFYFDQPGTTPTPVNLIRTGIAWPTDKTVKFHNPSGNLTEDFKPYAHPINWDKSVIELDPDDPTNTGFENEDLIVWMRTAALPTFRKLYRRIDHEQSLFKNQLPSGEYRLWVNYTYPVTQFEGTKRMILSTTSWLGGKNSFLGIAYIVVGCICLVLGFVFLVIHIKFGKSTHDSVNISQRTAF